MNREWFRVLTVVGKDAGGHQVTSHRRGTYFVPSPKTVKDLFDQVLKDLRAASPIVDEDVVVTFWYAVPNDLGAAS